MDVAASEIGDASITNGHAADARSDGRVSVKSLRRRSGRLQVQHHPSAVRRARVDRASGSIQPVAVPNGMR
jgi:hypothetical protein